MSWILITLLIGSLGGFIFLKLKIPAGAVIGAMVFVMVLSVLTGRCYIPKSIELFSRMVAGTLIGCRTSLSSLKSLKKIFTPMFFFTFFMLFLSIIAGFIVYKVSGINQATAFFGSSPGGLADMSLISSEFGADMSDVALLQVVRLVSCLMIIPFFVKRNGERKKNSQDCYCDSENKRDLKIASTHKMNSQNQMIRSMITVIVGVVGGSIGLFLSIPSGALVGAFLLVSVFNIFCFKLYIPVKIRRGIQILLGTVIGSGMTMEDISGLKEIFFPAILISFFLLGIGILMGMSLHKIWQIDLNTAIIATAPGGLTEMSLIAPEFGADVSIVTSLHFVRMVSVIIIYPIVMKLII